jgi:hypothetical protein
LGTPIQLGVSLIYTTKLHQDFIETIYRGGLVGFLWAITVLTILALVLRASNRAMGETTLAREEKASLVLICSLLAFSVVTSNFQPLFFWAYGAFPYYFYGGLALGIAGELRASTSEGEL